MFKILTLEKLKEEIDKMNIKKVKDRYIFFPIQHIIIVLFILSIYVLILKRSSIIIYILLFILIFSYMYTVYKNKIIIDNEKIVTKNADIYFSNIEKVFLKRLKVGKSIEIFLCILTKDKIENQIRIQYIPFYKKMIKVILEKTNLGVEIEN